MRVLCLFCWFMLPLTVWAQTNFSAVWPFDGSPGGSSNQANVGTGGADFVDVAPNNLAGYVPGQNGQAVNVANWSRSPNCNFSEYVQVSVSAQNGQKITLTQISVFTNRSDSGPQEIHIRSSVNNYSSDLATSGVGTGFQPVSAGLSGAGFTDQTGTITFRIYGCNGTGGTLRLDDLTINGTVTTAPLPVTLLYFIAKPDGDRVQLAWATTSELNASRFVVEHSPNLREFIPVGEVPAKGTTDERQYYGLTDLNPIPGINYYRLKQIDRDGSAQVFKPVSAIIQTTEPAISVFPNPAPANRIHLRLWNADDACVRLLNGLGQVVVGRIDYSPGAADFLPSQPLGVGLYWMEVITNGQRRTIPVLVR